MDNKTIIDRLERARWGCGFQDKKEREFFEETFFDIVFSNFGVKYKVKYGGFRDLAVDIFHPVTFAGELMIYNEETGLYYEGEAVIRAKITRWLDTCCTGNMNDEFCFLDPTTKLSQSVDEIMKLVWSANVIAGDESPFNRFNGIPVENGVVVFDENYQPQLKPYTPEMLFISKMPTEYNPKADTAPVRAVLTDWAGEYTAALVQAPAQAFIQFLPDQSPMKKSYFLCGQKNSGKSTYLELLEKTAGQKCVGHVMLQELSEKFNASELEGKLFNIGDDLAEISLNDCGAFKRFTGKTNHSVEEKYKKRHQARITAVHIYTANRMPRLGRAVASDDAFWERICVVPFTGNFSVSSQFSSQVFSKEFCEGFLLLAIKTASQMLAGGKLLYNPEIDETRELWDGAPTPLADFLEEATVKDANGHVEKADVLAGVQTYAKDNGISPREVPDSINALTREMTRLGYATYNLGRKKIPCYKGLSWKPGFEHKFEESLSSVLA